MFRLPLRLAVVGLTLCATLAGGAQAAGTSHAPAVTLTMWAGSYTPSALVPTSSATSNAPKIKGIQPVIDAYQKLHPNVTIKLIYQNTDTARTWMITQLTGGTAPDIIWDQPDFAASDFRKHWLVPIDSYLAQPNPYVAGNQHWLSTFDPGLQVWKAPDNHLYVVIADQVQVGIYYNKSIFAKAGITHVPPSDWAELMADAQKIKAAGFYPFAESGNNLDQLTWVSGWFTNFYWYPSIKKFDLNHDGVLDAIEMSKAVLNGGYSFTSAVNKDRLALLKTFSTYWQPGAVAADHNASDRLWLSGRAGIDITGSWNYETFKQDKQRTFPFGVFYFPVLNARTSPKIPNGIAPTNKAAGYGEFQFAVTNTAVSRHTTDVAFDFLKFATSPRQLSPMITEAGTALPAVKNTEANPDLKAFETSVSYPAAAYQEDDSMFDYQFAQQFLAVTSGYFSGTQGLDATANTLQKDMVAAAHRVLGQ
jgi:ABC-type glycerol-3-phosphate transport system substrate-binding protein